MLCNVVFRRAHAPMMHAASHVDHEKKSCMVFYFYACMWFCSYSCKGSAWWPFGSPELR